MIREYFIPLIPIVLIGLTIFFILLIIMFKRNNTTCMIVSVFSLIITLLITFFYEKIPIIKVYSTLFLSNNLLVLCMIMIILSGIVSIILSYSWLKEFSNNKEEFYILLLTSILGCIILIYSNHMSSLFIGMEMMSLTICGLISYNLFNYKYSLESSIKYSLISSLASAFILLGISFIYLDLGYLSFTELSKFLYKNNNFFLNNKLLLYGIYMIMIGFCIKLSVFPFHVWSPDVYQGTFLSITSFITTAIKLSTFVIFTKIFILLLPIIKKNILSINFILIMLASLSIICGSIMAVNQNNIKRFLSYSSISHFGYFLIIIITFLKNNNYSFMLEAMSISFFSYLLSNLCIFSVLNKISLFCKNDIFYTKLKNKNNKIIDSDSINFYYGLFWKQPILTIILTISMLSLSGIPLTIGFISKFYIFLLSMHSNIFLLIVILSIGSIISYYSYLRIVVKFYLLPDRISLNQIELIKHTKQKHTKNFDIIIFYFSLLIIILGIYPKPIIALIKNFI